MNDALVLILSRNAFYKRLHYLALGALFLNILLIILLMVILAWLLRNPVKPLYFAADDVGRLIQIVPVNIPNMPQDKVIDWTINAVEQAASYDFINYRQQLQDVEKYFTNYGWKQYMKALTASNNLLALTDRKQIVTAQVVEKPQVEMAGLLTGAYAWKLTMPLLVIYSMPPYDGSNQFSNALNVSVIVQRQKILEGDNGLGIVQLIYSMATNNSPATQPQLNTAQ
jgi:intracellular multiplication protein IcmL